MDECERLIGRASIEIVPFGSGETEIILAERCAACRHPRTARCRSPVEGHCDVRDAAIGAEWLAAWRAKRGDEMGDEIARLSRERDEAQAYVAAVQKQVFIWKRLRDVEWNRADKAEDERDEWREKAFNLPMAAKKSGYEDGKLEAEAHVKEKDAEIARLQKGVELLRFEEEQAGDAENLALSRIDDLKAENTQLRKLLQDAIADMRRELDKSQCRADRLTRELAEQLPALEGEGS